MGGGSDIPGGTMRPMTDGGSDDLGGGNQDSERQALSEKLT